MSTAKTKLSRADKKEIEARIARANGSDKKEKTAQDSIPYQQMYPDGICRVTDTRYVKTIGFEDINYQLSQDEDTNECFLGCSGYSSGLAGPNNPISFTESSTA